MKKNITVEDIRNHPDIKTYIEMGDQHLTAMGFTEHSFRHAGLVSKIARNILDRLNYDDRIQEMGAIAGFLHDIGNVISRYSHGQSGALISWQIMASLGMETKEIATIASAIGNHEEEYGHAVNTIAAALILADKSDVHRSRVRNKEIATFDIHDRVNYAVEHSFVNVDNENKTITLELKIDTNICPVMEYFEIFLTRMMMCRRAAKFLGCDFHLIINDAKLL